MNDHPSAFTLERFSVGDLQPGPGQGVAEHTARCARCSGLLEELRSQRRALKETAPARQFVAGLRERRRERQRRTRWSVRAAVAVAAATAAALFLIISPPYAPVDVTFKGLGLTVHRHRSGKSEVLESEGRIKAGDALRLVLRLSSPRHVGIWFIDESGRLDRYFPEGQKWMAAGEQALPGSAVVEAPCTSAWLLIGTTEQPEADLEAQVREAAARRAAGAGDWIPAGMVSWRLECE